MTSKKIKLKYLINLDESFSRRIRVLKIRISKGIAYDFQKSRKEWRYEIKILNNFKKQIKDAIQKII